MKTKKCVSITVFCGFSFLIVSSDYLFLQKETNERASKTSCKDFLLFTNKHAQRHTSNDDTEPHRKSGNSILNKLLYKRSSSTLLED